jgi:hypothetical protein
LGSSAYLQFFGIWCLGFGFLGLGNCSVQVKARWAIGIDLGGTKKTIVGGRRAGKVRQNSCFHQRPEGPASVKRRSPVRFKPC